MSPETLLAALILVNPALGAEPIPLGESHGLPVYLFQEPRPHILAVSPGVVIVLAPGQAPPDELVRRGVHLGGPSYRLASTDPIGDAERWASRPGVAAADPDVILPHAPRAFDDPEFGGQWYLDAEHLGMQELYDVSLGDPATRAAVLDSGIDIAHPDLAEGIVAPYDAVDEDDDPSPLPGEFCPDGESGICDEHGTAVSGIVAARANNGVGIVGLCPACTLVPIKLLGESDGALSSDVRSFEHAIEQDVAVINNSWGFIESIPVPQTLADVIHRAATEPRGGKGALVVFAAGNDDREILDDELQALPDVLCVSAVDTYGNYTNYTNRGASVDVSAPSATVSIAPGGGVGTVTFGGTSAAAPVVTGLAGWVVSVAPDLTAAELMELLISTAVQSPLITPDENGHHDVFGYGIVNPHAILARLFPDGGEDAGPGDAGAPDGGADAGAVGTDAGADAGPSGGGAAGGSGCAVLPLRAEPSPLGLAWLFLGLLALRRRGRAHRLVPLTPRNPGGIRGAP